jgi:hypothetical protein
MGETAYVLCLILPMVCIDIDFMMSQGHIRVRDFLLAALHHLRLGLVLHAMQQFMQTLQYK